MTNHLFLGNIVHSKSFNEFEIISNGFLAVSNGIIIGVGDQKDYATFKSKSVVELPITNLSENEFLMPGLIDCHIHASQMPNIGLGLDKELLDWLKWHTFPLEIAYEDTKFAEQVYSKVVKRTINNGTTLACYFATIHCDSTLVLANEAIKYGQRAFIGKVSANCNSPDAYVETTEKCIADNINCIEKILALQNGLVKPIITPRFAISCDMNLMKKLGELADKHNLNIQTHISENSTEISTVKEMFNQLYAEVYDEAKLLTNKCILAHAAHLEEAELKLLEKRGTSVAHCPSSNTNLHSGLCDVKRIMEAGVTVGLGTDISGGNKISMISVIRETLNVSLHVDFIKKQNIVGSGKLLENPQNLNYSPLTYQQAFYLATLGGAKALAVDNVIGNFVVGKEFDAIIVNPLIMDGPIDEFNLPATLMQNETADSKLLNLIQKFIYTSDDRNIVKVFVQGKLIKPIIS